MSKGAGRQGSGVVLILLLVGCSTTPKPSVRIEAPQVAAPLPPASASTRPGGYYQDDGPDANPPPNLEALPDAEPKAEPLHKFANRPYTVLGRSYVPDTSRKPYQTRGIASWYGRKFHGKRTSSGEIYDMYGMTAAHPTLPIPSYVRVRSVKSDKAVIVRVNDRGPFHANRVIDLSYTAASKLGFVQAGSGLVDVESIDPAQWSPASTDVLAAIEKSEPLPLPNSEGYWLQLGAFSVQANAEQLLERLKQGLGVLAEVVQIRVVEGLYRLRAGPFKSSAEADDMALQLKQVTGVAVASGYLVLGRLRRARAQSLDV